ncbi:MAG: GNAT family N-acetyltransferase [Solibacillus sp.]|uniref:GNAT family N-acetyltransferase n=1 Tax=Solibacillus sp. TaxID=1909654 RepID=UPI003315DA35
MEILKFENTIPKSWLEGIQEVHRAVFDGDLLKEEKLQNRNNFLAILAIVDGKVAAFKFGYEQPDGAFYSWLGGVHPNYQRLGIAAACMEAQHNWCRGKGYKLVRTYGRNEKKAMLIVNLKAGFNIIKTFVDDKGRHKIVFEKNLLADESK